jgi:hypothetical protein
MLSWRWKAPTRSTRAVRLGILILGAACGRGSVGASRAEPAQTIIVTERVDHLDVVAREPMVVEHPNGTLFVSGYGAPRPTLWKSTDRGATGTRVDVGSDAQGAVGNSDVDLALASDGTLYFASMTFDRTVFEGRQIAIGVSRDAGATWSWKTVSNSRFDDRPWVKVAPAGIVHAIWNDGSGVSHATSTDRGLTWTELDRIHDRGGSSHLAIGPRGEIAVRITPMSASGNKFDRGVELVAVSTDAGRTWMKHPAPGEREWLPFDPAKPLTRWVEPLAWDAAGNLYSLWTDSTGVWLARSRDQGATWTTRQVVDNRGANFFPYLIARGRGELAATWFSGTGKEMGWRAARLTVGDGESRPRVIQSGLLPIEVWSRISATSDSLFHGTGGEYIAVTFLSDGTLGAVSPIQHPTASRMGFTWWRLK